MQMQVFGLHNIWKWGSDYFLVVIDRLIFYTLYLTFRCPRLLCIMFQHMLIKTRASFFLLIFLHLHLFGQLDHRFLRSTLNLQLKFRMLGDLDGPLIFPLCRRSKAFWISKIHKSGRFWMLWVLLHFYLIIFNAF